MSKRKTRNIVDLDYEPSEAKAELDDVELARKRYVEYLREQIAQGKHYIDWERVAERMLDRINAETKH